MTYAQWKRMDKSYKDLFDLELVLTKTGKLYRDIYSKADIETVENLSQIPGF